MHALRTHLFGLISLAFLATLMSTALPAGAAAHAPTAGRPSPAGTLAAVRPHPALLAAASHRPSYVTVRRGDTLTSLARRAYGHAGRWPALWWINRRRIHNPNLIRVGQRLRLSAWHPDRRWLAAKAMHAIPKPPPPPPVTVVSAPSGQSSSGSYTAPATSYTGSGSYSSVNPGDYSGFQACVIARESGGNSQVMNSTQHYGLYQFDYPSWVSAGGNPGDFGHASVAEQNRVFASAYAERGTSPWASYDGCG